MKSWGPTNDLETAKGLQEGPELLQLQVVPLLPGTSPVDPYKDRLRPLGGEDVNECKECGVALSDPIDKARGLCKPCDNRLWGTPDA